MTTQFSTSASVDLALSSVTVPDRSPNATERSSAQKKQHCSSSVPPQQNCGYADQGTTLQASPSGVSPASVTLVSVARPQYVPDRSVEPLYVHNTLSGISALASVAGPQRRTAVRPRPQRRIAVRTQHFVWNINASVARPRQLNAARPKASAIKSPATLSLEWQLSGMVVDASAIRPQQSSCRTSRQLVLHSTGASVSVRANVVHGRRSHFISC